jgi:hypothetical protein
MSESQVMLALADALDAASRLLRERATAPVPEVGPTTRTAGAGAVERARSIHPSLGPRQAQILEVLEQYGEAGTNTGVISRAIRYSQPNVHLTLMGLMDAGLAVRDATVRPHLYWLAERLRSDG